MGLAFVLFTMLSLMPQGSQWNYLPIKDPIHDFVTDTFVLKGNWVDLNPRFPFQNAIPSLVVTCKTGKWDTAAIHFDEIINDQSRIEMKLDSKVRNIVPAMLWTPSDKAIFLTIGDTKRILTTHNTLYVRTLRTLSATKIRVE